MKSLWSLKKHSIWFNKEKLYLDITDFDETVDDFSTNTAHHSWVEKRNVGDPKHAENEGTHKNGKIRSGLRSRFGFQTGNVINFDLWKFFLDVIDESWDIPEKIRGTAFTM